MMGIGREFIVFCDALLSGIFLELIYQFLECFRHIVKHNRLAVDFEDILFWGYVGIYLFVQIYQTSDGSIRWDFILGVVVGAAFFISILKKIRKFLKKIYKTIP